VNAAVDPARQPRPFVLASCDFCGRDESDPVTGPLLDDENAAHLPPGFAGLRFVLRRCRNCRLVYLRERPHPDDLELFYPTDYKCFQSYEERGAIMNALAARLARAKLAEIERLLPAGHRRLLDYGCGTGTWLFQLKKAGASLDMVGTDVFEGPLQALRAGGLPAYCCDEETLFDHVERGSFGAVHMFHVIEHLPSPRRVLERLKEALVPGGVLLGQTPNCASWGCRYWGDLWNQWHAPHHFVVFDHDTLRRHAEAAGFEVLSIRNSLSSATQWAQSTLRVVAQRRGRPFLATGEPFYPPLILAFLPLAAVEALLGRSCHMDFVLKRPGVASA
jgi:SAM-dependent methyltransferase